MTRWLLAQPNRSWLLLIGATAATVWMYEDGLARVTVGAAILAITYAKGRLVILDFMELRHAPLLWRGLMEGWMLIVSGLLLGIYLRG
jgi:cytochrome c oxidase subunit IV